MNATQEAPTPTPTPPETSTPQPREPSAANALFKTLIGQWKVWLPGVGTSALLVHFWRIGYAPTLSFGDIGTVLGALLLFGTLMLLLVMLLLILPTVLIAYWTESHLLTPPPKRLAYAKKAKRRGLRSIRPALAAAASEPAEGWISPGTPPWFFLAAIVPLLVSAGLLYGLPLQTLLPAEYHATLVAILFAAAFFGVALTILFADSMWVRKRISKFRRPGMQFTLLSLLYFIVWILMSIVLQELNVRLQGSRLLFVGMSLFWIPVLHFTMHRTHRAMPEVPRPVMAFVPIAMFLTYSVLPLAMIDRALNTFGLGMLPHVNLVLTARGCDIAQAAWPQGACVPQRKQGVEAYRLENVEVLTRIGAHVYVGAPGAMNDESLPRFPIPSGEVLSWRRMPPPKAGADRAKPKAPKLSSKPPSASAPSSPSSQPSKPAAATPPAHNAPR